MESGEGEEGEKREKQSKSEGQSDVESWDARKRNTQKARKTFMRRYYPFLTTSRMFMLKT